MKNYELITVINNLSNKIFKKFLDFKRQFLF